MTFTETHWREFKFERIRTRLFDTIKFTMVSMVASMFMKKDKDWLKRMKFLPIHWPAYGLRPDQRQFYDVIVFTVVNRLAFIFTIMAMENLRITTSSIIFIRAFKSGLFSLKFCLTFIFRIFNKSKFFLPSGPEVILWLEEIKSGVVRMAVFWFITADWDCWNKMKFSTMQWLAFGLRPTVIPPWRGIKFSMVETVEFVYLTVAKVRQIFFIFIRKKIIFYF